MRFGKPIGGLMKGLWNSPLGMAVVSSNNLGITALALADDKEVKTCQPIDSEFAARLDAHVHNKPASIKVDIHNLPPFRQLATAKLLEIPYGEVRSYSWLAREVGKPNAIRAVASACSNNPMPLIIPCHRVVRTDGSIGNYSLGGSENKTKILAAEGVDLNRLKDLCTRHIRFLGDPDTKTFHVVSCRRVVEAVNVIEMRMPEEAQEKMLMPCRYCRPVHMF